MKVLLLGAGGLLGYHLRTAAGEGISLTASTRADLDVRDTSKLRDMIASISPDWIVNATAFTNVDAAEDDHATAFAVNAEAVGAMAAICRERGHGLLHVSTDYVFDGTKDGYYVEDDVPQPVNAYGRSKLAGEAMVRESGARHLVIRTQWLFGHGRCFARLMLERARAAQPTRVVADQFGCCTYASDAAAAVWRLLGRCEGVIHVANRGRVTRYDIARQIFEHEGVPHLLRACASSEFPARARRPSNTPLSVSKYERFTGEVMPGWEDALSRFLERERFVSFARGK